MSYISWRKDNEDRILSIVNDGAIEILPAWKESSTNKLSDVLVGPIVDDMLKKDLMIPITFATVFAEYLFEQYHVSPVDIEIFTQMIIKSEMKHIENLATRCGEKIEQMLIDGNNKSNDEDNTESKGDEEK